MPEIDKNAKPTFITEEMPMPAEFRAAIDAAGGDDAFIAADSLSDLREERNKRIAESDWMANSDVSMSDEWKTYRQALRDITKTYKNLQEVVWPDKPGD